MADNGTIELKFTIPWKVVADAYEEEVNKAVKTFVLPGFRTGMAPRELVEAKLDKNDLYSHCLQHLLPEAYARAVKAADIKPILYPHIHIESGETGKDWQFTAETCVTPAVTLTGYQKEVSLLGKTAQLEQILELLRKLAALSVPDLLVIEETNHRLGSLAENLTKLGLTTENYLQTKKLTPEDLKAQLAKDARTDLETEFILEHIRNSEKLENRAKTLDFLLKLASG